MSGKRAGNNGNEEEAMGKCVAVIHSIQVYAMWCRSFNDQIRVSDTGGATRVVQLLIFMVTPCV